MRLPRELDKVEVRVLGALLEKEQTTPDYYPLTLNSLVAACNQRSNRDPVMDLSAPEVEAALDRLHREVLVWPTQGSRVQRWRHSIDRRWELEPAGKAVVTLLLLRGAQTVGELRSRSERMHAFASIDEVAEALELLAAGQEPLVVLLSRRPGQKEARWTHLVEGRPVEPVAEAAMPQPAPRGPGLAERVENLEQAVAELSEQVRQLAERFGSLRE